MLTPAQRSAVRASRTQPVTVISGAPGTGKSHTICAVAMDALAHGRSVLVGAKTDAAVDALIDLFQQAPGPEPVVFGSDERRDALADRLSAGQLAAEDGAAVTVCLDRLEHASADRQRLRSMIAERLDAEVTLDDANAAAVLARVRAPGLFAPTLDLGAVTELVGDAKGADRGWFRRRRARRALTRLDGMLGASRPFAADELRPLLDLDSPSGRPTPRPGSAPTRSTRSGWRWRRPTRRSGDAWPGGWTPTAARHVGSATAAWRRSARWPRRSAAAAKPAPAARPARRRG